ncbi:MAG: glycosyltransferase family 4 protein [Elusimicrobia bacterium]|nr:glycosyltransferase family 4 protein [Elusimicrobiota bacterium]
MKALRIGLDISSAFARNSGISFYVENLLAGLAEVNKTDEFFLYTAFWKQPARLLDIPVPKQPNFHVVHKRIPQRFLLPLDEMGAGIQDRWCRDLSLDLFHGLGHLAPPLRRMPVIVTVHHVGGVSEHATRWERFYLGPLTDRSVKRADRVVAVSEYSRREAIKHWALDPAKVVAVHEGGPAPVFKPRTPHPPAAGAPYILHVGSFLEHKNIPLLIGAFHRWISADSKRPETLVLVGRPGRDSKRVERLIGALKLDGRVKILPPCTQKELVKLYQDAAMVAVPSLIEGFGFPLLEAMACGVPVLSSNSAALPEVAGDAALLLDGHDEAAWAEAMRKVATDGDLAADLKRKGFARAHGFSWAEAARRTLNVYREALASKLKSRI